MTEPRREQWEELLLEEAARGVVYPATPGIESAVRAQLVSGEAIARSRPRSPLLLRAVVALAVLVVAASVAVLVSVDARSAVADFLGLAVEGEQIERLPTPRPAETPTPFPTPESLESFATPTTLDSARAQLGFAPQIPTGAGVGQAYIVSYLGVVPVLVLHADSFDLWEEANGVFIKMIGAVGKGVPEQTVLEELTVNGRPAYWIEGGPHLVRFIGPDGKEAAGSQRTVLGKTLVWRGATLNYRLETDGSKEEAVRIASELP